MMEALPRQQGLDQQVSLNAAPSEEEEEEEEEQMAGARGGGRGAAGSGIRRSEKG